MMRRDVLMKKRTSFGLVGRPTTRTNEFFWNYLSFLAFHYNQRTHIDNMAFEGFAASERDFQPMILVFKI
ncbi:hypothetical protein [Acidaminococcus massiliensis]|uniref:hypothetical protein n=1 Tax=Acidaminococcus massiliensis TaxID=1852375 RepID=UPI0022E4D813|nr:hypothetical protein [Acidaminococcus massiliensis]